MSEGIDLAKVWKKYTGKWVAFDAEFGMICAHRDVKKAQEKARKLGFRKLHLYNVSLDAISIVV